MIAVVGPMETDRCGQSTSAPAALRPARERIAFAWTGFAHALSSRCATRSRSGRLGRWKGNRDEPATIPSMRASQTWLAMRPPIDLPPIASGGTGTAAARRRSSQRRAARLSVAAGFAARPPGCHVNELEPCDTDIPLSSIALIREEEGLSIGARSFRARTSVAAPFRTVQSNSGAGATVMWCDPKNAASWRFCHAHRLGRIDGASLTRQNHGVKIT